MELNPLIAPLPRRTILAAAAATSVLAACGGADSTSSGSSSSSSSSPPSGDGTGSAAGEVLATTSEVPVAGGVINKDAKYVVTQPQEGQFKAFSSVCPHQQCQVGTVKDNVIVCPCHGSRFNAETGDVEAGPAPRGLAPIAVEVQGDSVVRV
jgi:nitrite reductase/ring-hydroxylating ferredoxin subunit